MIKNIEEMRNEVVKEFEALQRDPKRAYITKELANAFGKCIQSCAVQIEYAAMRREIPEVPFLGKCGERKPLASPSRKTLES